MPTLVSSAHLVTIGAEMLVAAARPASFRDMAPAGYLGQLLPISISHLPLSIQRTRLRSIPSPLGTSSTPTRATMATTETSRKASNSNSRRTPTNHRALTRNSRLHRDLPPDSALERLLLFGRRDVENGYEGGATPSLIQVREEF